MSYGLSPSIEINEKDFLVGRRQVANRFAGTVGNFNWGEVGKKVLIRDEKDLVEVFHDPDDNNFADWYCVNNYNAYNDKLWVVRAIKEVGSDNAGICITKTGTNTPYAELRKNLDHEIVPSFDENEKFKFLAKYPGEFGNKLSVAMATDTDFPTAEVVSSGAKFKDLFEYAPATDEVALVVLLNEMIVERFIVSLKEGHKNFRGEVNYIEQYIERKSRYIYAYDNKSEEDYDSFEAVDLAGGAHVAPTASDYNAAFNEFKNADEVELDVLFIGGAINVTDSHTVVQHVIDNILEKRKDIRFVFDMPTIDLKVPTIDGKRDAAIDFVATDVLKNSSYAAYYPDAKYQFDRYNDKWRWMPINGDIAGIYSIGQAFEAPAGLNRGILKNCQKLLFNPDETLRDVLYPLGINSVSTIRNIGHVVMGQKTLLSSSSIFSRVDTRGLFILLQKNAKDVARFYKFQKNNPTERRRFVSDIEPLFRTIQGLGGIEDYLIVCDESNNTGEVKEANEMIADFFVKPEYSTEWIRLNFNATRATVNFEEVVASPII